MPAGPTRFYYGTQMRSNGGWLWPRACWEYDLEKAKAAALRTWPYAVALAIEERPNEKREAWICRRDTTKNTTPEWQRIEIKMRPARAAIVNGDDAKRPDYWWQRD